MSDAASLRDTQMREAFEKWHDVQLNGDADGIGCAKAIRARGKP